MPNPKVVAFAGSTRSGSFNKKLIALAAAAAKDAGADVTLIDLRDYPMPLYDGDFEAASGIPENATKLKAIMIAAQGLLIASPEYNSSISGVLKNTIDWLSRPVPGEPPLAAFIGKVAGLMAASPGALGGLRGLVTLRSLLGNIGVLVIPEQVAVSKANEAFENDGKLKDPKQNETLVRIAKRVTDLARKIHA